MTEYPNFEERVLNKLDSIETKVNKLEVSMHRDYVTRREYERTQREAQNAKRWAMGMIIPFLILGVEALIRLI